MLNKTSDGEYEHIVEPPSPSGTGTTKCSVTITTPQGQRECDANADGQVRPGYNVYVTNAEGLFAGLDYYRANEQGQLRSSAPGGRRLCQHPGN